MTSRRRDSYIYIALLLGSQNQGSSTLVPQPHQLQRRQLWKVKHPWGLNSMKTHMVVPVLFVGRNTCAILFTGLYLIQMGALSLKGCSDTAVRFLIQENFLGLNRCGSIIFFHLLEELGIEAQFLPQMLWALKVFELHFCTCFTHTWGYVYMYYREWISTGIQSY